MLRAKFREVNKNDVLSLKIKLEVKNYWRR
jgi:hypothetical protein